MGPSFLKGNRVYVLETSSKLCIYGTLKVRVSFEIFVKRRQVRVCVFICFGSFFVSVVDVFSYFKRPVLMGISV